MKTDREPDLKGQAGVAWKSRATAADYDELEDARDRSAGLVTWLLKAKGFHAAWDEWVIGLVHLRDIVGQSKAPTRSYPEAEYELMILSLDPRYNDQRDPDTPGLIGYLEPPDLVHQFHGITDEQAIEIAGMLVENFVNGVMSPDRDWRKANTEAINTTVMHFREGRH